MYRILAFLLFLSFPLYISAGVLPWNNDIDDNTAYDEAMARRFFDLAVASQLGPNDESKRQQCFDKSWADYKYETKVVQEAVCDNNDNTCQMYIAYSATMNNYVISFRGTHGFSQLITESMSSLNSYQSFAAGTFNGKAYVNHYFYEGAKSFWPAIKNNLTELNENTTFFITGHSLGGAMASITAARVSLEGIANANNKIRLYTFGQPRTWDYYGAQNFKSWVPHTWRIVHNSDPVPHGPPLGKKEEKAPYHHTQEIWYTEKFDSYKTCSTADGEDGTCSDSISDFKFVIDVVNSEHLHYFGVKVNDYGAAGCSTAFNYSLFASFFFVFVKLFIQ